MPVVPLIEAMAMPEPPPSWMWTMMLLGPDGIIIPPAKILEAPAPFTSITPEQVSVNGLPMSFPAGASLDSMDVTIYESFTFQSLYDMQRWCNRVRDKNGNYGLPANYLGTAIYMFHDTMGIPQYIFQVDGIWPTGIHTWGCNYHESDGLKVNVTLETYSHYGDITIFGTLEDLVSDLTGDIPIVNSLTSIGTTIGTGML